MAVLVGYFVMVLAQKIFGERLLQKITSNLYGKASSL